MKKNIKTESPKIGITQYIDELSKSSMRLDIIRFHLMSIIGSKHYFSNTQEISSANLHKLSDNISFIESLLGEILKDVDIHFMEKLNSIIKNEN